MITAGVVLVAGLASLTEGAFALLQRATTSPGLRRSPGPVTRTSPRPAASRCEPPPVARRTQGLRPTEGLLTGFGGNRCYRCPARRTCRQGKRRYKPNAVVPHARPRGVDAGAAQRLLDGRGQQANHQDRISGLRRSPGHGRDLRPGSRGERLHGGPGGLGLGTRDVLLPALESGEIDLQPEYIGSGLAAGYGGTSSNDPAKNRTDLQAVLNDKGGGITVLDYTPAVDTNALVVRQETADEYSLATWGDLAAAKDDLQGLATDCPTNPLCAGALKDSYGIDVVDARRHPPRCLQHPRCAEALKAKTIDVAELCSTGPEIIVNGWVRLEDRQGDAAGRQHRPARARRLPGEGRQGCLLRRSSTTSRRRSIRRRSPSSTTTSP